MTTVATNKGAAEQDAFREMRDAVVAAAEAFADAGKKSRADEMHKICDAVQKMRNAELALLRAVRG